MDSPDRLQCRAYMVATLLRQIALAPEFFEQVWRIGGWSSGRAIGGVGVGGLPAPTALDPLTELFSAVEQARVQLSRSNPMAVQLLKNLGVNFYGLVVDSQPEHLPQDAASGENTNPHAPEVPQVTRDAIEIIGKLLLDARQMLMHRKNCPAAIGGAPVVLEPSTEGVFQAIEPAAIPPPQLTPFNMAVADFFGATNVVQQSWTEKDFEPIRKILMEYVLREIGILHDFGDEVFQPNGLQVRAGEPAAPRAAPVQSERRRRAQSAPPCLTDESSIPQVVQPIADARVHSHTASADAAQGSPGSPVRGGTSPTESARGTPFEGQGNSENSRTLASNTSTSVAEAIGLPVDSESNGSTSDAAVILSSSDTAEKPVSQKGLRLTKVDRKEVGSILQNKAEDGGTISSPVVGAPIGPRGDTRRPKTPPIDADLAPADVEPAGYEMPMEIGQNGQDKVDGGLEAGPIDEEGSPAGAEPTADHEMPMEVEQEERNLVNESPILDSVTETRIQNGETGGSGGSGTGPIDNKGSPAGAEPAADLGKPMEIDQGDQNSSNPSTVPIAVTNTVPQNGSGTSSSSSSGQGPSNVVHNLDIQEILVAIQGLPVPGLPTSSLLALPMPRPAPLADQAPTERRKHCKTRRYTPGPPPASEQDDTEQTNTRKPGRPRKHRPPPASGSSRAGQVPRSRSPLVRQLPAPTYQKITKDREARFQKKKTIFLATRGTEHHPGSEVHDRKIAEAVMHCSESEVYNHPKLQQIMPHIHTLLFNVNSTGPLPQVKTVKEVKAEELFLKWNLEINGEDDKFEWKELIRKKDPAYEEWWGLAVKMDKEQLEQMELGWITGAASDFGIEEGEDVAGPSGRGYREFSPEL